MTSLTNLNAYSGTEIAVADNRLAKVVFDGAIVSDQEFNVSIDLVPFTPVFNIEEVINYETANARYRVSIISNSGAFVSNSYIIWPSLPAGVTSSASGGVYTLSGINSKSIWNAIKSFQWKLPSNFATYTSWYLKIAVVYYDQALAQTIEREIDFFDKDFYPISKLQSSTALTCSITYNIVSPGANLQTNFFLFTVGELFIALVGMVSTSSTSINVNATKRTTLGLTATATMTINGTRILSKLLAVGTINTATPTLNVYKDVAGTFSSVSVDTQPFANVWLLGWAPDGGSLAVGSIADTIPPTARIEFYRNGSVFTKQALVITPPKGPELRGDLKWNYNGTSLAWADIDDQISIADIATSSYTILATPAGRGIPSHTGNFYPLNLAWHPSSNIIAVSYGSTLDSLSSQIPVDLYIRSGNTFQYLNSNADDNYVPTSSRSLSHQIDWNPAGTSLAMATGVLKIYNFVNNKLYFVTAISVITGVSMTKVKWSNNGTYVAVASNSISSTDDYTNHLKIYKKTGDTYTSLSIPSPLRRIVSLGWNLDDSILSVGYNASGASNNGYIEHWNRSGDTFTKTTPTFVNKTPQDIAWRRA
jgi:hypothetical protein